MRKYIFVALAIMLSPCAICGSRAEAIDADSHEFPGKGSKAAWEDANGFYIQGVQATQSGKVDQSIALYKKAISIYPDDPDFQINLGVALEDKGTYKEAETVLNHAFTLAPQNWAVPYNLGNVLYAEHKYQDAINAWTKAMAMDPPDHFKKKAQTNIAAVSKQFLSKAQQAPKAQPQPQHK